MTNFFSNSPLNIHDQPERHQTVEKLCRGVVLDIGCGTGSLSEYYKGEYIGFDISKVAIEKAKEGRRKDAKFFMLRIIIKLLRAILFKPIQ